MRKPIPCVAVKTSLLILGWVLAVVLIEATPAHANGPFAVGINSMAIAATPADGGQTCPASVLLGEDPESLQTLRRFRDESLMQTDSGRILTGMYYEYGPLACAVLESNPQIKAKSTVLLNAIIPLLVDQQGRVVSEGLFDYIDCIFEVLGEIGDCDGFDFDCVFDVLAQVFDCF